MENTVKREALLKAWKLFKNKLNKLDIETRGMNLTLHYQNYDMFSDESISERLDDDDLNYMYEKLSEEEITMFNLIR